MVEYNVDGIVGVGNITKKEDIVDKRFEKEELLSCIKEKAKELWEKDGCKSGRDFDYWLQAEKIVKGQMKKRL